MPSTILYHPNPNIHLSEVNMQHLSRGLESLGVKHEFLLTNDYKESDLAVVPGWIKALVDVKGGRGDLIRAQLKAKKRVMILERGFLGDREKWASLPWDGMSGYGWHNNADSPSDRWDLLGLEMKPWRTTGHHILICGQVPWDSQVDAQNHTKWLQGLVKQLKELTDRTIIFRLHPKIKKMMAAKNRQGRSYYDPCGINTLKRMGVKMASKQSLQDDLKNAWAMVCFNSNSAVEALLAGVPTFMFDECGMAWPIANHDLNDIETPELKPRPQWAYNLAYAQWCNEEFESGLAWRHLTRGTEWEV